MAACIAAYPYLKADVHILERARYFTGHGYVYVALDVRGRGDSDGQFVPYATLRSH
ncbi:MAG: hypothetical protein NVSMB49_26700 [Ktedonobacteraceae bacterium]